MKKRQAGMVWCIFLLTWCVFSMGSAIAETQDKLNVMILLPLSGPIAPHGQYLLHGIEMYQEDVPDSRLNLSIHDSKSDPKTAMSILAGELAKDRPSVIISSTSDISKAVIDRTEKEKIFTLIVLSTSQSLIQGHEYIQRISPPTIDNVAPIANYAKNKFSSVSILYSNGEYGLSNRDMFSSIYTGDDTKLLSTIGFMPGAKDIRTIAIKAMKDNPEAIYVTGYERTYCGLLKTLRVLGYKGTIMTDTAFDTPAIQNMIGDAAEGIVFVGTQAELKEPSSPKAKDAIRRYEAKYKQPMMHFAALTYDALAGLEQLAADHKPLSQSSFSGLKTWEGFAYNTEYLPGGECRMPTMAMVRQKEGNTPLTP